MPDSVRARSWAGTAAGAASAWLVLWLLGYPASHHDNSFFTGAAIHLARTGELANPWIERWLGWLPGVPAERYFLQPPYQAWAMGTWLRLTGVGTGALTGFACLCGAVAAFCTGRILARTGASRLGVAAGMTAVSAFLLTRGMRPEVPGIAALMTGMLWLHGPRPVQHFAGGFATFAAPLFHPILLVPALASAGIAAWNSWQAGGAEFRRRGMRAAIGAAVNLPVFLAAIGGQWGAFWHDFMAHADFVRNAAGSPWDAFVGEILLGWDKWTILFVMGTTLALVPAVVRGVPHLRGRALELGTALGLGLVAGALLYAPFVVAFAVLAATLCCAGLSATGRKRLDLALTAPAILLTAWVTMQQGLQLTADLREGKPGAALRTYVENHPPALLGVDAYTVRHVFGFDPPGNVRALDWGWSPGFEKWTSPSDLGPDDVWVVNPAIERSLAGGPHSPRPLKLLGRTLRSVRPTTSAMLILGSNRPEPPPGVRWIRAGEIDRHP